MRLFLPSAAWYRHATYEYLLLLEYLKHAGSSLRTHCLPYCAKIPQPVAMNPNAAGIHRTIDFDITALKERLMRTIPLIAGLLLFAGAMPLPAQDAPESMRTPAPEGAEVYFQSPADGATVTSPVTVRFGLRGLGVAPAGIPFPETGHHHVLIDVDADDMPPFDLPLPTTDRIVHFGLGQTEAQLTLAPGRHTLQLVVGDYLHTPHSPPIVSETITITVAE